MVILTGKNLGERQKELNAKVKEAALQQVNFNQIKDTTEESDVDKLFKIDLASKYMNIDYIIEVLKSGDSLYISRGLKCSWIYGDDFSHVINVDNLKKNVIPFMSIKMKKKLLTAVSVHVRNESRAADFYKYCRDIQLDRIALKFLIFTSENFKLEALKDKSISHQLFLEFDSEYLKNFVGLSFTLAEAFIKVFETDTTQLFRGLSYLYTVSEEKYLDLLEQNLKLSSYKNTSLGLRISRSIMKHHKDRVLKNPSLYVNILSESTVTKYSTADDAKICAAAVLPDTADAFWYQRYCRKYKFLLDRIVASKFQFIKQIFTDKYPKEEFETTYIFYQKELYKLMTAEEQETWALKQLASEAEILGVGKDYLWYKFVSFDKAFPEIKKLVLITPDNTTRADMMLVLADSAKNQRDVEKLMKHYYERHVNEQNFVKENFLDSILQNFNVFKFDENCWTAFNKMFHNLDVYNLTDYNSKTEYRIIALVYNIINEKDVPEAIKKHISNQMPFYHLKTYTDKLTKEQQEMVFNYLFNFYMDEIRKFENVPYTDEVKYSLRKYIHYILDLLAHFERTKEDCPELVNSFMKLDWDEFKYHRLLREESKSKLTVADLLRDLKKDSNLFIEHFPRIQSQIDTSYRFKMSAFLRKLKIYFSNDYAKKYLQFFESLLTDDQLWHKTTQAAAHGIFQLGDEKLKINFMEKYAPNETKIDHSEIEQKLLRIQQAICAQALYSWPPVPLKSILKYVKGDYVQYCLPMFNSYLANLPLPLCMEFVEALLDTPVSIQKHGIRLAFECFNTETLNTIVLRAWKKTKNVSLRLIIYKAIFHKITQVSSGQDLLFDTLKKLTLTLQPDDNEEIFNLLISRQLPEHFTLECIAMAWKIVSQFPPKSVNLSRMRNVIMCISTKIDPFRQEFVREIIDAFIASVFTHEECSTKLSNEAYALIDAKWKLTATYIINVKGKEDIGEKKELAKLIMKKCLDPQETRTRDKKRALLKTCFSFIHDLENQSYDQDFHRYENVNSIMQSVLEILENALTIEEIYMAVWEIRLGIVMRRVIVDSKVQLGEEIDKEKMKDITNKFAYELGVLIKEFTEKELFFASFSSDIKNKITSKTQTLKNLINSDTEYTDMMTYVCLELLKFENTQVYLLILNLMPANCHCDCVEDFKTILFKLNKMNNKEIRCNLYRKLAMSNLDESAFMYC